MLGQHDSVTAGSYYTLLLDQWNVSDATYGSCCASLMYVKGTTVAWKNVWNWGGGSRVKSFTNMQLNSGLNKQLSAIKSIWVGFFSVSFKYSFPFPDLLGNLGMATNLIGNCGFKCCIRSLHVVYSGRKQRQRDHDMACRLQCRSNFESIWFKGTSFSSCHKYFPCRLHLVRYSQSKHACFQAS